MQLRETGSPQMFSLPGQHPGLLERGNIDIANRPIVANPDGSWSTVKSVSWGVGGREVLMPTVIFTGKGNAAGWQVVSPRQALLHYMKTGENLGTFKNPATANRYAVALHKEQA